MGITPRQCPLRVSVIAIRVKVSEDLISGPRSCKFYYHMDCVSPPLQAKPAKGYSWMCSPCNRARLLNLPLPGTNTPAGRPKGSKNKDINLTRIDYDKPDANFRGWNFRYFGYVGWLSPGDTRMTDGKP